MGEATRSKASRGDKLATSAGKDGCVSVTDQNRRLLYQSRSGQIGSTRNNFCPEYLTFV